MFAASIILLSAGSKRPLAQAYMHECTNTHKMCYSQSQKKTKLNMSSDALKNSSLLKIKFFISFYKNK